MAKTTGMAKHAGFLASCDDCGDYVYAPAECTRCGLVFCVGCTTETKQGVMCHECAQARHPQGNGGY